MRLTIVAALSGIAAIGLAISALPAGAEPNQGTPAMSRGDVAVSSQSRTRRARQKRARTRITVRKRSYLDGGTEVLPGERKFTGYAFPLSQSVTVGPTNTVFWHRSPLPGPFDLPGKNNPIGW